MHAPCPVVKIIHPQPEYDFLEINASDYDPKIHTLYAGPEPVVPPAALPPPPPVPASGLGLLDLLPNEWREKPASNLKALAQSISGRNPEDKKQAIAMIEQAIAARKGGK